MGSYLTAFAVYTLAMIGVIFIAFLVWKKTVLTSSRGQRGMMKVEEMLSLNSRKALYIVRVQQERFLIASDVDRTTFLAKLPENKTLGEVVMSNPEYANVTQPLQEQPFEAQAEPSRKSAMRNILKELTRKNI